MKPPNKDRQGLSERRPLFAEWADVLKCPADCPEPHHILSAVSEEGLPLGLRVAMKIPGLEDAGEVIDFELPLPMIAEMVEYIGRMHLGILPGGQVIDLDEMTAQTGRMRLPPSSGKPGPDAIH